MEDDGPVASFDNGITATPRAPYWAWVALGSGRFPANAAGDVSSSFLREPSIELDAFHFTRLTRDFTQLDYLGSPHGTVVFHPLASRCQPGHHPAAVGSRTPAFGARTAPVAQHRVGSIRSVGAYHLDVR